MKILITGATGFIGGHLLEGLCGSHELCAVVRDGVGGLPQGVDRVTQDLTEPLDRSKLPDKVDAIIHLAQSRAYKSFPEKAGDIFDVNIRSTFELLEYGRSVGIEKFIYASSGGVCNYSPEKLMGDGSIGPIGFYWGSKHASEMMVSNYSRFFPSVILRFFFVYGSGQENMLVPTLLRKVLEAEKIVIEGDPGLRVNPIYVEDVVNVFEPALQLQGSGVFDVAGDEVVSITDLVKLIAEAAGKEALVEHTDADLGGDLVGDNSRMKEVLGVIPQVTFLEGVRRML